MTVAPVATMTELRTAAHSASLLNARTHQSKVKPLMGQLAIAATLNELMMTRNSGRYMNNKTSATTAPNPIFAPRVSLSMAASHSFEGAGAPSGKQVQNDERNGDNRERRRHRRVEVDVGGDDAADHLGVRAANKAGGDVVAEAQRKGEDTAGDQRG
jgi:hypothetical protein